MRGAQEPLVHPYRGMAPGVYEDTTILYTYLVAHPYSWCRVTGCAKKNTEKIGVRKLKKTNAEDTRQTQTEPCT